MSYDSRIILGGQQVDVPGAMAAGNALAAQTNQLQQQNALAELYRTQGPGIMAGDQGALNALASIDPAAGLGFQQTQLGMDQTRQQMNVLDETTKREAEKYASSLSAEQRAAEAAELEGAVKQALMAPTPQAFDALMIQMGQPDMVGQFEDREQLAAQYMSIAEIMKMNAPVEPDFTTSQKDYNFYAQQESAAGRAPMSFNDWDTQGKKAAAASTTVTVGGDSGTKPGQVFDEVKAGADAARAAANGLKALREAEKALTGGAITGFAADSRLAAAKLGALIGVTDPAVIENTETFRSAIAPQVAAMLKSTVGSTQISTSDREFAEKAAGGSIALDESTIIRLLGIMEKAATATLKAHQERLDLVYPPGSGADRERALFGVVDSGADPAGGTVDAGGNVTSGGVKWSVSE